MWYIWKSSLFLHCKTIEVSNNTWFSCVFKLWQLALCLEEVDYGRMVCLGGWLGNLTLGMKEKKGNFLGRDEKNPWKRQGFGTLLSRCTHRRNCTYGVPREILPLTYGATQPRATLCMLSRHSHFLLTPLSNPFLSSFYSVQFIFIATFVY